MKKLKVLLVDDEIMIREGFKQLFDWGSHDCQVVGEAADGMEALGKIDSLRPDIVIMDINIPIMNGLKVIQLSRVKHPNIAFVIVSGYDDFSYCQQALRLQITDYILKPVNYEEFGTCIDNLKISLFERRVLETPEPEAQEGRAIAAGGHTLVFGGGAGGLMGVFGDDDSMWLLQIPGDAVDGPLLPLFSAAGGLVLKQGCGKPNRIYPKSYEAVPNTDFKKSGYGTPEG